MGDPFEGVRHYQFAAGSALAGPAELARLQEAVACFDRAMSVPASPEAVLLHDPENPQF